MAALSHPTGFHMFSPPNPNGMGGPPGPPYQYGSQYPQQHYHQQPAPRQRTAIACRYCRRRKIRCSGFETSPDGRCANCSRFNQECVFTPVSSQTQAFVPAHAISGARPQQLYGPQGQPLPAGYQPGFDYHSNPPPLPAHQSYRLPSPNSPHPSDASGSYIDDARGRGLPPPPPPLVTPSPSSNAPSPFTRRSSGEGYQLLYTNAPTSPSSHLPPPLPNSTAAARQYSPPLSYAPHQQQQQQPQSASGGGYYPNGPPPPSSQQQQQQQQQQPPPQQQQQGRPDSPSSFSSSSDHHHSHHSVSPQPQPFHPPMLRPASTGPSSPGQIPSMQIGGLIDPNAPPPPPPPPQHQSNSRSAADGDMLNRLNSRPPF